MTSVYSSPLTSPRQPRAIFPALCSHRFRDTDMKKNWLLPRLIGESVEYTATGQGSSTLTPLCRQEDSFCHFSSTFSSRALCLIIS